jgi:salicylate hydroxylase
MRAIVVGGGIGGLAAALFLERSGHDVVIVEQARVFGAVGAGIQLSPNATLLLGRLGVLEDVEAVAVRPQRTNHRRWSDGSLLGTSPMGPEIEARYGSPYLHVFRPDLIDALARHVETDSATVVLSDGTRIEGDLVVGSDGIHSVVRPRVLGEAPDARYSGHIAYRAVLDNTDSSRPSGKLVDEADVNVWLGPGAHVVQYLLRREQLVNLVLVEESSESVAESWNQPGDPDAMRSRFQAWDPELNRILEPVRSTMRWALHDHQPLPHWTSERVCLLGDAAHPMLPYLAQGGAQSIEDGAALAALLGRTASVPDDLRAYECCRIERTSEIQLAARAMGVSNHFPDGPDQQARDARMAEVGRRPGSGRLDIYGHDAEATARSFGTVSIADPSPVAAGSPSALLARTNLIEAPR